jgi:hypothetical protein
MLKRLEEARELAMLKMHPALLFTRLLQWHAFLGCWGAKM